MGGKVLVTGASGLAGANLVRILLEYGRDVRALVHSDQRALEGLDIETVRADIRDQVSLAGAMAGMEVVYHLAGSISLEMDSLSEMNAINVLGTHNVVAACLKCGVHRLVHFSSIDALRHDHLTGPVDESQPLVAADAHAQVKFHISPYDLSKAQGEREVLAGIAKGLDAIIIRPTAMLGPHDYKPSFVGKALIQLANGKIPALVTGGFDWVDVRDVAIGAINAEQAAPTGSSYMLGGHWHTIRQVANLVADYTERNAPPVTVPLWLADAFAPAMLRIASFNGRDPIYTRVTLNVLRGNVHVNTSKAKHELGYSPRPLAETVHDVLTWFHEHDYLRGSHY